VDEYGIDDVKREVNEMIGKHHQFAIHWFSCNACTTTYVCEAGLSLINKLENGG
jgi:hypothetical protein